jgi:hypothetical protein
MLLTMQARRRSLSLSAGHRGNTRRNILRNRAGKFTDRLARDGTPSYPIMGSELLRSIAWTSNQHYTTDDEFLISAWSFVRAIEINAVL